MEMQSTNLEPLQKMNITFVSKSDSIYSLFSLFFCR